MNAHCLEPPESEEASGTASALAPEVARQQTNYIADATETVAVPRPDRQEMRRALQALIDPSDLVELRAFHNSGPGGKEVTSSACFDFDHWDDLVAEAERLNLIGGLCCITLNPPDSAKLKRLCNRMFDGVSTTADKDIRCRRRILIDVDSKRVSDTSATREQVEAALAVANAVAADLSERGWPMPIAADSGNGTHLVFAVDLPNDSASAALVQRVLKGLAAKHDTPGAEVDTTVHNAARICKLWGSVASKGTHTAETPHRLSKLLHVPKDGLVPVSADQLRELADELAPVPVKQQWARQHAQPTRSVSAIGANGRAQLIDDLESALGVLDANDRGEWIANGMRLKGLGEEGRALWLNWSAISSKFDQADAESTWLSFKPDNTSYQSVFADAQAKGWVNPANGNRPGAPRMTAEELAGVIDADSGGAASTSRKAQAVSRGAGAGVIPTAGGDAPAVDSTEAIRRARAALAPSLKGRAAPVYPAAALGPLSAACEVIASAGQVQPAMAGQCLLGAASLLTQGLFNVETLAGKRPLSLYLLTLGDSGDGKSTAQGVALAPVNDWQRREAKRYSDGLKEFERDKAKRKRGDEPPEAPACPFRLVGDATVEGLRRDLDTGVCSQGVFTDEAAAILSGYGMSPDHRSKTAGVFSKLWDNGHLSVSRVTGGRVERYGRRIALHWLIQPMAASESIGDPLLAALGFWPRFLAAWPEPQAPRLAQAFRPELLPAVRAYWQRCNDLLDVALPEDAGDCPTLPLTGKALSLLGQAFEGFEHEARRGGLQVVKPFALRASEQACRVAGVLSAFEGKGEVSGEAMQGALALVAYSLKTWQAIIGEGAADQGGAVALRLYEWLTTRPGWCETLAAIVNGGPPCVRSKDKRDAALSMLESAGLVRVDSGKAFALLPGSAIEGQDIERLAA